MPHHEMTGGVPVLLSFVSWGGTPTPPNTFRGNAHMVVSLDIHIHAHTVILTHLTLHRVKIMVIISGNQQMISLFNEKP